MTMPAGLDAATSEAAEGSPPWPVEGGLLELEHTEERRRWLHEITGSRLLIGRQAPADLVLDDPSVSPLHAELIGEPSGRWWLRDLGSEQGTFVGGRRTDRHVLRLGEEIRIGVFRLRFRTRTTPEFRPIEARQSGEWPSSYLPPTLSSGERTGSLEDGRAQAAALASVVALGHELMAEEDLGRRRRILCDFLVGNGFPGQTAAVVRISAGEDAQLVSGPTYRPGVHPPWSLPEKLVQELWESRRLVMGRLGGSDRSRSAHPRDAILCPLEVGEQAVEALYLELAGAEWPGWASLAAEAFQQANLVWQMREQIRSATGVQHELEMAGQLQLGLLPRHVSFGTADQELDVSVGFEPCRSVGGDYVDAVPLPDGRILLTIADVCGKGMQAALVASSLHTLVRVKAASHTRLPDLIEQINLHLCRYLPQHLFVTMLCAAVDVTTGELEIVSAGHPAPLVVSGDGSSKTLELGHNVALGMIETRIESGKTTLGPDDVLLLYTDGITEAVDPYDEPFGEEKLVERFRSMVAEGKKGQLETLRQRLLDSIRAYRGGVPARDDTTFLLARRRPLREEACPADLAAEAFLASRKVGQAAEHGQGNEPIALSES